MKKVLTVLLCFLFLIGFSAEVYAHGFTLETLAVNSYSQDPGGLQIDVTNIAAPLSFDLTGIGDTASGNLFTLDSIENYVNNDDLIAQPISVLFDFSTPDITAVNSGMSVGVVSAWGPDYVSVTWNDPVYFSFGDPGLLLSIDLENVTFNIFNANPVDVVGTFALVEAAAPAPVPEPATMLLLGTGLFGIAGVSRKKILKKK